MYFRIKNVNASSETVVTENGVYLVCMTNNGYTINGIQKVIATVVLVKGILEPRANWVVSATMTEPNNYANAYEIVRHIEDNMKKNGIL